MKLSLKDATILVILFCATLFCQSAAKNIHQNSDEISFDDFSEGDDEFPVVTNKTIMEAINKTEVHRGFLHGFGESISVILVSEIGDKTFFIAAIMAMTNNKLTVFLAAISALAVMTVMSALLGWVVTTFIPREVTYYTCTAIMFLFGLKMLWEAWRMDDNEMEETQREVREELARRGSISSTTSMPTGGRGTSSTTSMSSGHTTSMPSGHQQSKREDEVVQNATKENTEFNKGIQNDGYEGEAETKQTDVGMDEINKNAASSDRNIDIAFDITNENNAEHNPSTHSKSNDAIQEETSQDDQAKAEKKRKKMMTVNWTENVIDNSCRENSWFGKKCLKIFKLFVNCFSMTFIAEWGDRSQLATIVLAGINDIGGVCVGGVLGHIICTSGAVLAGALISRYISVRKVTFFGALVFLGFAVASIFIDPTEEVPNIIGYSNATRILNKNVSLTLMVEGNNYQDY